MGNDRIIPFIQYEKNNTYIHSFSFPFIHSCIDRPLEKSFFQLETVPVHGLLCRLADDDRTIKNHNEKAERNLKMSSGTRDAADKIRGFFLFLFIFTPF